MAKISESIRVLEALADSPTGEKVFKVILISEGLGNTHNMNFYGPGAITSAIKIFDGQWCFLDHQDGIEKKALPERSIRDKAGWYAKLRQMIDKGKAACGGELYCDLSESGRMLAEKLASALAYKKQFAESDKEYCGLSVNGDCDVEKRTMTVNGEELEVNYVLAFSVGESCDLVTSPARGGRGLAVISESVNGHVAQNRKESNIMKKALEAIKSALATIRESLRSAEGDAKAKLSKKAKTLEVQVKALEEEDESEESETEALFKKKEGEDEAGFKSRMSKIKAAAMKALGEKCESDGEDEDEDEDVPPAKKKDDADTAEAKREAVTSYMLRSGLPTGAYSEAKVTRLATLKFKEAKATIEDDAKLVESTRTETAKALNISVASLRGGTRETADTGSNDDKLQEAFNKEKF